MPYLTYRLAGDGMEVIRLENPVHGAPFVINQLPKNYQKICIDYDILRTSE